jgi:hypothetical protein
MKRLVLFLLVLAPGLVTPLRSQTYQPTWESVGQEANPSLVRRRQVWDFHSLGRLLGPGLCARDSGQAGLRGMVLAPDDGGQG